MERSKSGSLAVLLLLHSRVEYLQFQLESLLNSKVTRLYVSIDGARNQSEAQRQKIILELLKGFESQFEVLEIRRSQTNLGLGLGVVSGLDWFFMKNEKGMIFEDDVLFNSDCVRFFNTGVTFLSVNKDLLLLGGSNPFENFGQGNNVVLTNYPQIWGWASTRDKWLKMRSFIVHEPRDEISLPGAIRGFWKIGWRRVHKGYIDTWDTPIAAGMRLSGALCMLPPVNLTSNQGFDAYAVNTKQANFPLGMPISKLSPGLSFDIESALDQVEAVNREFELKIYRVALRHKLAFIYGKFDWLRIKRHSPSLTEKLRSLPTP